MSSESHPSNRSGQVWHPDYGQFVNYELHDLPDDADGQVEQTISLMRGYVNADKLAPAVGRQVLASQMAGGDPVECVFNHVHAAMRFRNDDEIHGRIFGGWKPGGMGDVIEIISRPVDTAVAIERGFIPEEDCDGFSTYAAALLAAQGIPCAFVTVGADAEEPWRYSHVYVVAYPVTGKYAGRRVALDTSHGGHCGWECPNRYGKLREWSLSGDANWMSLALAGLVGYAALQLWRGRSMLMECVECL
jgi:hypothetical protein